MLTKPLLRLMVALMAIYTTTGLHQNTSEALAADQQPKRLDEGLYPVEDPTGVTINRGVRNEPKRTVQFLEPDPTDPKQKIVAVAFDNTFPGGRLGAVMRGAGPQEYVVYNRPENRHPINDSPWYAFRVTNQPGAKRIITITLAYEGGESHRFTPKISYDGQQWATMDARTVAIGGMTRDGTWGDGKGHGSTATFSLELAGRPVWIAAQELITSGPIQEWVDRMATSRSYASAKTIGKSHGDRSIPMLTLNKGNTPKPTVVLTGRLHPPEVSGTLAQMAFVETMMDDSALSKKFLEKFNVIIMPNLNPDGVEQGHWRHNGTGPCTDANNDDACERGKGGADLNRDWKDFNQPEARAARDALLPLQQVGIAFSLEFHSTYKDLVYVLKYNPEAEGQAQLDPRVAQWMDRFHTIDPTYDYKKIPVPRTSPILPKTVMGWMGRTFNDPPMVAYEVGASTPRPRLTVIASNAATSLMEHLLNQ